MPLGSTSKFENWMTCPDMSCHYIAEILLIVTLNHNKLMNKPHETEEIFHQNADMAGCRVPVHISAVLTFTRHKSYVFCGQTD